MGKKVDSLVRKRVVRSGLIGGSIGLLFSLLLVIISLIDLPSWLEMGVWFTLGLPAFLIYSIFVRLFVWMNLPTAPHLAYGVIMVFSSVFYFFLGMLVYYVFYLVNRIIAKQTRKVEPKKLHIYLVVGIGLLVVLLVVVPLITVKYHNYRDNLIVRDNAIVIAKAVAALNATICDEVVTPYSMAAKTGSTPFIDCYTDVAIAKNDETLCEKIKSQICYWSLAKAKNDSALCEKMSPGGYRETCYYWFKESGAKK